MKIPENNDTISAISTPTGEGGIGIVRISGKDTLKIADKIFVSKNGKKPSTFETYTVHYGYIVSALARYRVSPLDIENAQTPKRANAKTEIVDEVILTIMRSPRSYTKEDVVEINCHGGIVPLRKILELTLENGARLAAPGEFTRRAFLNGRIDLAQAEAVIDIIRAKTDSALKIGVEQLKGALSLKINSLRKELLDTLTFLEANLDFPEEEIGSLDLKHIREALNKVNAELKEIIESSKFGRIMREGIHVVICGRPNAGKSSLLNAFLKQERSIVTSIPGTTRDTIEEVIDIKGIPVRIVDTAGILEPRDLIEKKAVLRSKRSISLADLVIIMFDGSKKLAKEDLMLMSRLRGKQVIAVINKADLKQRIEKDKIREKFKHVIGISAKKTKNIDLLESEIVNLVHKGRVMASEPALVANLRHAGLLKEAQKLVASCLNSLDNKLPFELIAQDIKEALGYFDDILGKRFSEELLDKLFSQFCIGK